MNSIKAQLQKLRVDIEQAQGRRGAHGSKAELEGRLAVIQKAIRDKGNDPARTASGGAAHRHVNLKGEDLPGFGSVLCP